MTDIAGERRAAARAARQDLEAIFGAAPASAARTSPRVRTIGAGGNATGRPSRASAIGISVALGLAGVALGALLTRPGPPSPEPRPAAVSAPSDLQVVLTPQAPVTPLVIAEAPPAPRQAAKPAAKSTSVDCAKPGGRRCSYSVVLAADSSLRKAYRRAASAGVSRSELATYRRSWSRLRPAGARDPDRVVRGYRGMAADLNRLARERRS